MVTHSHGLQMHVRQDIIPIGTQFDTIQQRDGQTFTLNVKCKNVKLEEWCVLMVADYFFCYEKSVLQK